MTCSRGAASASATTLSWPKVRTTAHDTQRSRLRATSATVSRAPSGPSCGGAITSPPSSWTAISKVARVRSDGLSNSSATCWPASACAVGARRPELALGLQARRQVEHAARTRPASRSRTDRKFCGKAHARAARSPRRRARRAARNGRTVEDRAERLHSHRQRPLPDRYGAVLGVDLHVFGGEIARPHGRVLAAVGAEIDARRGCPCPAGTPRPAARARRTDGRARTARCRRSCTRAPPSSNAAPQRPGDRDEAAPVRVAAVDRGLHQQRVGDGARRLPRVVVGAARRSPGR